MRYVFKCSANVFAVQIVLQVLEFDLRSCDGARALLVTSPAAVFDDGEVRGNTLEERRVAFRTLSQNP